MISQIEFELFRLTSPDLATFIPHPETQALYEKYQHDLQLLKARYGVSDTIYDRALSECFSDAAIQRAVLQMQDAEFDVHFHEIKTKGSHFPPTD